MIEILLGATEAIMNPPKMAELGLTPKSGFLTIITVVLEGVLTEKGRSRDRRGEKENKSRETRRERADRETERHGDRERRKERDKETRRPGDKERGDRAHDKTGDV